MRWVFVLAMVGCSEYDLQNSLSNLETPDTDGDGLCDVPTAAPRSEADPACEGEAGTPPQNPWSVATKWRFSNASMVSTPSVGDLDGDGVPSVVVTGDSVLYVFNGETGAIEWQVSGADSYSGSALADIDRDGDGDVVATVGGMFTAFDGPSGGTLWATTVPYGQETYPAIADLDGDGDAEVVINETVLDAATGEYLVSLDIFSPADNWGAPAIADMDLDGQQEILLMGTVFSGETGDVIFTCGNATGYGVFPHPVNVDDDPEAEMLVSYSGNTVLCDDDGTQLATRASPSYYGAAIAVADFDGDGEQEFALAEMDSMLLLESDLSEQWSTPISDYSGLAGSTSWDINLDGVPEVIYADETDILAFDGSNGEVVIRFSEHESWTAAETPAVADVDGDGQGDLLYTSNGSYRGLTVVSGTDGDWPYARPVYNQATYSSTNINDDLSVPTNPEMPWLSAANLFRGQPSELYVSGISSTSVEITDACVLSCDSGSGLIAVQVWNDGTAAASSIVVSIRDESGTEIATSTVGTIAPQASAEFTIELPVSAFHGTIEAVVTASGDDCDPTDNAHVWTNVGCD